MAVFSSVDDIFLENSLRNLIIGISDDLAFIKLVIFEPIVSIKLSLLLFFCERIHTNFKTLVHLTIGNRVVFHVRIDNECS